jgi:hypothetical protein
MVGRIHMEVPDDFFGRVVEVAMDEGEKPESRHQDQASLGALEEGDHTEAAEPRTPTLAAIWTYRHYFQGNGQSKSE